jgi:hypothetical protein
MQLRRAFFLSTACTTHQGLRDVGALQHGFLGLGVGLPAHAAFQVHGAELPLLERVVDAAQEAQVLLSSVMENQYLMSLMPERTSMRSNSGTERKNSSYSSSEQKPITRSTPARLYQLRSNSTISPAAGRCDT